jgi:hypothetical protein
VYVCTCVRSVYVSYVRVCVRVYVCVCCMYVGRQLIFFLIVLIESSV